MSDAIRRQSLGDLLRRTRQRTPEKVAIRCGATSWTYSEFDDICNRLAAGFAGEGVRVGDRVAIIARNSHAFAAVRLALARLGAVLGPINFILTPPEGRFILEPPVATSSSGPACTSEQPTSSPASRRRTICLA